MAATEGTPEAGAPQSAPIPGPTQARSRTISRVVTAAVAIMAGLLIAANATLNAGPASDRRPTNLRELLAHERSQLEESTEYAAELQAEMDEYLVEPDTVDDLGLDHEGVTFASGRSEVQGDGITIELWDAPAPPEIPTGMTADDFVVHQQDMEAVINALWAGGAEAITVQGHRLTNTTQLRCVGNVLLIGGYTYSPPYVIEAIGDPIDLRVAVHSSPQVQIYHQFVEAIDLGWSFEVTEDLIAPAATSSTTLTYARVPGID